MPRSALSLLLVVGAVAGCLSACAPHGAVAPLTSQPTRIALPPFGAAPAEPAPPMGAFRALMPTIRERAKNRGWGHRILPPDASLGTPLTLYSYSVTPAATFWGGVESTITGYALPVLDAKRQTIGVVRLTANASSSGDNASQWVVDDVGYLQWEGLPVSGALYSGVVSLVAQERARLGPAAVIRVADTDGAAAVLGTSGSTALFAYVSGIASGSRVPVLWRIPGYQPNEIISGPAALGAARALSHEPATPGL